MTEQEIAVVLRTLLREKVHVRPQTIARLPSAQAERLRSPLALGRRLLEPLDSSSQALLHFWATHPRGHVVINPSRHGYSPGPQAVGRRKLEAVAWISAPRLLATSGLASPLAHLLDHLLGSDGQEGGSHLSEGGGRNAAWSEIGRRLQRQFNLGYGPPEAATNPHDYFAWGLQAYLADRPVLNVVDPGLERILRNSLFSTSFWQQAGP